MNSSTRTSPTSAAVAAAPSQRPGLLGQLAAAPWRRLLRSLLDRMDCGRLDIVLPGGERLEGHGTRPGPHAHLVLHRWRPIMRLLAQGDLGLAESFRDGDWSTPDLGTLLLLGSRNEAAWGRRLHAGAWARAAARLLHAARANTRRGSRRNIAFHYDLGNRFYARWLDAGMQYSSALYATGRESLEQAQAAKIDRVLALLALDEVPDHARVLEIGCGWGGLAVAIAERHGAQVTGLTLSTEQLAHARERAERQGVAGRIELRLQDYRDVRGRYDRIVSVEMIEAVGERYWGTYFDTLRERLAPGGHAVLQVITIDDAQFAHYRDHPDFIQRHIFPGGMLPPMSALQAQADRVGLALRCEVSFGASYACTLAAWRQRFHDARAEIGAMGFDAGFRRLWEYYLSYCEAGFLAGRIDVKLITLRAPMD